MAAVMPLRRIEDDPLRGFTPREIDLALAANEDGDAALLTRLLRGRFCYDHAEGRWYVWAGHFWKPDKTGERFRAIQEIIDLYATRAFQRANEENEQARNGEQSP